MVAAAAAGGGHRVLLAPPVGWLQHRSGAVALEPLPGRGVALEVGVPECGADRKDRPVVVRVRCPCVAGQGMVGESRMPGAVEHEFVLAARGQGREHGEARGQARADRGHVFRAGHQQPWDPHLRERPRGIPTVVRSARAERDGRFDPGVGEGNPAAADGLAADGLRGHRAERMAGHAETPHVHPSREHVAVGLVPVSEPVDHSRDILDAEQEVLEARGLLQGRPLLPGRLVLPYRGIASRMLEEDGHIPACRPVVAQVGAALAGPTQPMAEKHNRGRRFRRRQVGAHGNRVLPPGVVHREVSRRRCIPGGQGQGIVRRVRPGTGCQLGQQEGRRQDRSGPWAVGCHVVVGSPGQHSAGAFKP